MLRERRGRARRLTVAAVLSILVSALVVSMSARAAAPADPPSAAPDRSKPPSSRALQTVRLPDGREAIAGRAIVRFKDGTKASRRSQLHGMAAMPGTARPREVARVGRGFLVQLSASTSVDRALRAYSNLPEVLYAQPDLVVRVDHRPDDVLLEDQWALGKISAFDAWDVTKANSSIKVAILDCGIYHEGASEFPGHPDINGKVVADANFAGTPDADDWCDHGTHVAGTVAANTNNGIGVSGIGYDAALLNVKVLDDFGSGSSSTVANGITWATDNGAHVINMSLGGAGSCELDTTLQDAVDYAVANDVVVIAAAGNGDTDALFSPASCDGVLSVAATDEDDDRASFSNYGTWVDVAAPGVGILSTDYVGGYSSFSGTSMAAPHVSGIAALLWSTSFGTSAAAVVDRISGRADEISGTGTLWASGRVNAADAVGNVVEGTVTDPSGKKVKTLANVIVEAYDTGAELVTSTKTGAKGTYSLRLAAGDYHIKFDPLAQNGLLPEWWEDVPDTADAATVAVDDADVTGIDASLGGWRFSGNVTDQADSALAGALVQLIDTSMKCCKVLGAATTDENGDYTVSVPNKPPTKTVALRFSKAGYLTEFRDDAASLGSATRYVANAHYTGLDAALVRQVTVSGKVTSALTGKPVRSVLVTAHDPANEAVVVATAKTSKVGQYRLLLPAGDYRIRFAPPVKTGLASEWWDDQADFGTSDLLTCNTDRPGTDALLGLPAP